MHIENLHNNDIINIISIKQKDKEYTDSNFMNLMTVKEVHQLERYKGWPLIVQSISTPYILVTQPIHEPNHSPSPLIIDSREVEISKIDKIHYKKVKILFDEWLASQQKLQKQNQFRI